MNSILPLRVFLFSVSHNSVWRSICACSFVGLLVICFIVCSPVFVFSAKQLTILYSSEHHGVVFPLLDSDGKHVGGVARRATLIQEIKKDIANVLVLDSGDILVGTALSSWFRGEPDIKAMNLMGYQGMVAGNHEFDYGFAHLKKLQSLAKFPILCTNLTNSSENLPCVSSAMLQIGGISIGLLGVVGHSNFPETFNREAAKSLKLHDPIDMVKRQAWLWKQHDHVDVVIVLTHQTTAEDRRLLDEVEDLDVIIGGHTKGFDGLLAPRLARPVEFLDRPKRVFVKTHRQGRTLGRLDLHINHGQFVSARATNIPVEASVKADETVQHLLDVYERQFREQHSKIVGRTMTPLIGDSVIVRTQETNLGDYLADLLRKEYGQRIAFVNSGQIRATIPAGPIDLAKVFSALPFDSSVVTLELTGYEILEGLENSVSLLPEPSGRFLQVSGMQILFDLEASVGSRVQRVSVGGHLLDLNKTYTVVTDAFIADGGDGYSMFRKAKIRINHDTPTRDIFLKALAENHVNARTENRIQFTQTSSQ